ncbi:CD1375 family protein [Enterococcus hirae]|nr:CD1375 family protein [Enterococcus hirae]
MIQIYVNLIRKGLKKIEDVPEKLKEKVQAILAQEAAD